METVTEAKAITGISENFPPDLLSVALSESIIKDFTNTTSPIKFEETRYTVCGQLSIKSNMTSLSKCNVDLDNLVSDNVGISRKE